MKAGVLYDIHAGDTTDATSVVSAKQDGQWFRVYENWSQRVTDFSNACVAENVDVVIVPGDLVDRGTSDGAAALTALFTQLKAEITDVIGAPVIPMIGNHDNDASIGGNTTIPDFWQAFGTVFLGGHAAANWTTWGLDGVDASWPGIPKTDDFTSFKNTAFSASNNWTIISVNSRVGDGPLWIANLELAFTLGTSEISVGDTITGKIGGATAVITKIDLGAGSWATNDQVGTLYFDGQVGAFQAEIITVAAVDSATIAGDSSGIQYDANDPTSLLIGTDDTQFQRLAQWIAEADVATDNILIIAHEHISDTEGSGLELDIIEGTPLGTTPYIFDTIDSATGKVVVLQGHLHQVSRESGVNTNASPPIRREEIQRLSYDTGDGAAIVGINSNAGTETVGDVITGVTSGATATVRSVGVDAGTAWETDAAGDLWIKNVVGTFQNGERLSVGGTERCTTASTASTPVTYISGKGSTLGDFPSDPRGNTFYILDLNDTTGEAENIRTFEFSTDSRDRYNPTDIDNVNNAGFRGRSRF